MLGSSRAVFRWFYYFKSNLITATKNIINARGMLYGGWWMIKIPLKLSSDFRTKQQEASPKVVRVVHNSPRVLEQNRNTGLFFFTQSCIWSTETCTWLFLLTSWRWLCGPLTHLWRFWALKWARITLIPSISLWLKWMLHAVLQTEAAEWWRLQVLLRSVSALRQHRCDCKESGFHFVSLTHSDSHSLLVCVADLCSGCLT